MTYIDPTSSLTAVCPSCIHTASKLPISSAFWLASRGLHQAPMVHMVEGRPTNQIGIQ